MTVEIEALKAFDHDRMRISRGGRIAVSPQTAQLMRRKGLATIIGDAPTPQNPTPAGGETSSVSPAAPVSPEPTAPKSKRGGRKKTDEE